MVFRCTRLRLQDKLVRDDAYLVALEHGDLYPDVVGLSCQQTVPELLVRHEHIHQLTSSTNLR